MKRGKEAIAMAPEQTKTYMQVNNTYIMFYFITIIILDIYLMFLYQHNDELEMAQVFSH